MPTTRPSTTDHYVFRTRSHLETTAKAAASTRDAYLEDLLTGGREYWELNRQWLWAKAILCRVLPWTSSTDNCRLGVSLIALDNFHRIVRLLPQWNITN